MNANLPALSVCVVAVCDGLTAETLASLMGALLTASSTIPVMLPVVPACATYAVELMMANAHNAEINARQIVLLTMMIPTAPQVFADDLELFFGYPLNGKIILRRGRNPSELADR